MRARHAVLWFALAVPLSVDAAPGDADAAFTALADREVAWSFREFPVSASYAGIHDYDDQLGDVSDAAQQRRRAHWAKVLEQLDAIEVGELSKPERVNYRIFRDQVRNAERNIALDGHLMPLNSDSAYYSDVLQLPRAHAFATADDYRKYLKRLAAMPQWLDQNLELLKRGVEKGMTVPHVVMEGRDAAIAEIAETPVEKLAFYEPFAELPPGVPADQQAALRAEAEKIIGDQVLPAYRRTLAYLRETYIPRSRKTLAASKLPNGDAYYRQQILEYTTLSLSPDEIHAIGQREVKRIRAEMEAIVREVKFEGDFAAFLEFLRTDPQFYAKTPEELLMRAAWIAKRVDAMTPKLFGTLPRKPFGIAPVPAAIAPFYTAGRYAGAPEGSDEPGYYWVNTTKLESRPLYALPSLTLHEAVPGHHLQNALASEQGEQPIYRRTSYISAFGEGWGLYSEHLGIEMGIYRTPYENFGRLTYEMWRACRLVVDTGVHAKGWTREQALAFMRDNTALSEHEISTEVDRYISWPGQALSYKLGELKLKALRAKAEETLGAKFDVRRFHDRILALGSVPLDVLSEEIDGFIAEEARR